MGALQRQRICSQENSENKDAHETFSPISTEDGARGAHALLRVKPSEYEPFPKVPPNALECPQIPRQPGRGIIQDCTSRENLEAPMLKN